MRAEINEQGKLVLTPETSTELFAINTWKASVMREFLSVQYDEATWYRGSAIQINHGQENQ